MLANLSETKIERKKMEGLNGTNSKENGIFIYFLFSRS